MEQKRPIKVLVAKAGLDGHDRGAKVVALGLRDEGMEVIYSGLRQTPEKIAQAALQEDVDVVGLSCLSGAHKYIFPEVIRLLKENGMDNTLVICGGIIPEKDIPILRDVGVKEIFGPGSTIKNIANSIRQNIDESSLIVMEDDD